MRYDWMYSSLLAAIAALAIAAHPAHALSPDLRIALREVESGPYLPGLPILLAVEIRNAGASAVSIPAPALSYRDDPYNAVDIFTATGAGAPLERVKCVIPEFGPWVSGLSPEPPEPVTLAPDEARELGIVLSYDWKHKQIRMLAKPGTLRVQAALCDYGVDADGNPTIDRDNRVESNVLELAVAEPDAAAAKAWELAKQSERTWFLAHPAALAYATQDGDFRLFQEVAAAGDSPYSRHASVVVAYMYALGNGLDLHPGRPPQPQVAKQWLDKAMGGEKKAVYPPDWEALAERLAEPKDNP